MAGLWSVKFDHANGELRKCRLCGNDFHAKRAVWRCTPCVNKAQKVIEEAKRGKYKKKDIYPFDTRSNAATLRFKKIRSALNKAWREYDKTGDKSIILAHYNKQLQEIQDNGIMEWIIDRRNNEARKENNPNSKSKQQTDIEYPNTREMPYE